MEKAERRQTLLSAARDVFAKQGFYQTTVDDIAHAAGVARGTFYLYFDDKRTIFEEIVDRFLAKLAMTILRVDPADPNRSVHEQIRENLNRIVTLTLEDRGTTKLLLADALGIDPAFDRKLTSFYGELHQLLERTLAEGQELGIVDPTVAPRHLGIMILGAMKEVLLEVVQREEQLTKDEIVAGLFAFFRTGFLK